MHTLVIGGSASGKSELAELLTLKGPAPHYYIATMEVHDAESQRRVARHQNLRAGKGFWTIERPVDLGGLRLPKPGGTALIECVTNLVANECFSPNGVGMAQAVDAVLAGADALMAQAMCIFVTGDVFADGIAYDTGTQGYLKSLAAVNAGLAAHCGRVVESVCGLPQWLIGGR